MSATSQKRTFAIRTARKQKDLPRGALSETRLVILIRRHGPLAQHQTIARGLAHRAMRI
jgi:hypothetical protein